MEEVKMQITSKYTIALHTLLCIEHFSKETKVTSNFIASSVNTNPVIIRNILGMLKDAGIVNIEAGVGGATIIKDLYKITMFDIFNIINPLDEGELFHFHENPNINCPIGNNIHNVLDKRLNQIEEAMLNEMKKVTIKDLIDDMERNIKE
jgi:DNA-binding IscR family transcriptional regulator